MAEREKLIELKDLQISFGTGRKKFVAVDHVNFDIYKGETFSLVGESGSGKTTIGRAILRINPTSAGDIYFKGQKINGKISKELDTEVIRKCQMIFQDPIASLDPRMTVKEIISEGLVIQGERDDKVITQKVNEMLELVGINNVEKRMKQYPHEFSGGMRQRVVIAIAVACSPKILICDEPTTALDVTIQAQILQLLKEMRFKYDLTIVMITHDLGVVANIADRVAVMYAGDIVEIGTADEIYYDPRHPYTWALLSSMPQMGVKGEDLFNIVGTPPNLFAEIRGDAFAPRNPQALKIDFVKRPPYFEVTPTHKAKTWLLDPRAPRVEPPAAVKMLREEGL